MNNKNIIILAIILLILDFIYISIFSNHFKNQVLKVQKKPLQLNIKTTILCYILIIFCLYYFIIKNNKSVLDAFVLGICVYGIYELTTISLLSNWELKTVIIDTVWGGILFSLTTNIYYKLI